VHIRLRMGDGMDDGLHEQTSLSRRHPTGTGRIVGSRVDVVPAPAKLEHGHKRRLRLYHTLR
jgi:hypothetical protein